MANAYEDLKKKKEQSFWQNVKDIPDDLSDAFRRSKAKESDLKGGSNPESGAWDEYLKKNKKPASQD